MLKIQKQISRLYAASVLENLSLTGAWVAILAARGYTLVEIGIAETVFHIVSLIFELPSGVLSDVFGRKKMLIVSTFMQMIGNLIMIFSFDLSTVCLSIAFQALSYNFASGSGDALAYDSLKSAGLESQFEQYGSNQLLIYRLLGGLSTLCAGFALFIGHKTAYSTDLITGVIRLAVLSSLTEIGTVHTAKAEKLSRKVLGCIRESLLFLKKAVKVLPLMFCNAFVGAADTLLLFFLQAKLQERGIAPELLGVALLIMSLGGIVGSRLILKLQHIPYHMIFLSCTTLVLCGILLEHAQLPWIMMLGGFLSAAADDALQVRTNARIQDMIPSDQRATLTSVDSFLFSVVMIILTPLAGIFFTYW